ncbi:MAG: hypothetical protein DDT30_01600 [Dehalococcoidia bacterium]|nr:hypothetical protein [Bacillota bacterium]
MKLSGINAVTEKLTSYFKDNKNVLLVILFGSFATLDETPLSDIDIAVLLDVKIPLMDELKLSAELSMILKRDDVDLVLLRNAPVNIAHKALSTGRIIYKGDYFKVADFIEDTLNAYRDYGYRLRKIDNEFDERLQEDYDGQYR